MPNVLMSHGCHWYVNLLSLMSICPIIKYMIANNECRAVISVGVNSQHLVIFSQIEMCISFCAHCSVHKYRSLLCNLKGW